MQSPLRFDTKNKSDKRIDKIDFLIIRNVCASKETIKKVKRQPVKQEKIFAIIFNKEPGSRIYKKLLQLKNKNENNPIQKLANDMNRHFHKEAKYIKKILNIIGHQENINQTTMRCNLIPTSMLKSKRWKILA